MSSEFIGAGIFACATIFTAGGIVYSTRRELARTRQDLNSLGKLRREDEKAATRRYQNMILAVLVLENDREERFRIASLLREG